ncbi:MAG: HipA family kinase [Saprospiraceae bacterium]
MKIKITEVQTVIKEIQTGHKPIMALCEDGNTYFVKRRKTNKPNDCEIISEFVCSAFLRLWEINTPKIKGIIVDPALLRSGMPSPNPSWLDHQNGVCFGSRKLENPIEITSILNLNKIRGVKRFANPYDFFRIGLFDLWLVNEDRNWNNPNLLLLDTKGKFDFYAMDHAYTFGTRNFDELDDQLLAPHNDSILDSSFAKKIIKGLPAQLPDFHKYFQQSVNLCHSNHEQILKSIESCLGITIPGKQPLEQFLYDSGRLTKIYSEFQTYF